MRPCGFAPRGCGRTGGVDGSLVAERLVRWGYFGLGNDTEYDKDLITEATRFPLPRPADPLEGRARRSPGGSADP